MIAWQCSIKKVFLKISQDSQAKTMCRSLFFNEIAELSPATINKRFWRWCFSVKSAKFLKTDILKDTSGGCFCIFICLVRQKKAILTKSLQVCKSLINIYLNANFYFWMMRVFWLLGLWIIPFWYFVSVILTQTLKSLKFNIINELQGTFEW